MKVHLIKRSTIEVFVKMEGNMRLMFIIKKL